MRLRELCVLACLIPSAAAIGETSLLRGDIGPASTDVMGSTLDVTRIAVQMDPEAPMLEVVLQDAFGTNAVQF